MSNIDMADAIQADRISPSLLGGGSQEAQLHPGRGGLQVVTAFTESATTMLKKQV